MMISVNLTKNEESNVAGISKELGVSEAKYIKDMTSMRFENKKLAKEVFIRSAEALLLNIDSEGKDEDIYLGMLFSLANTRETCYEKFKEEQKC